MASVAHQRAGQAEAGPLVATAAPGRDGAADLAIGLVLTIGVASWAGLVLAQLGRFGVMPVVVVAALTAVAAGWALRRVRAVGGAADRGARWRRFDGALVFAVAAALYLPGYDVALYGSDATVYLGEGVHIARTGALAIEEPLLRRLPHHLEAFLFPPMSHNAAGAAAIARSPSGLVYEGGGGRIFSTFSQLPSVWVAIGFALHGLAGALAAVPLLAAGAVMAFYVFVRRTSGALVGAVAAALLGVALPQLAFARVTMGECGAQLLLWGGLLAYDRHRETGATVAALAAGVGWGVAGLARPEYIAFLPLALVVLYVVRGRAERPPALAIVVAGLLFAHAVALVLFVVPTHYRHVLESALYTTGLAGADVADVWLVVLVGVLAAVGAAAVARVTTVAGRGARGVLAVGLGLWAVAYATMGASPSLGLGLRFLTVVTAWPVLVLALVGLPLLAGAWRTTPAGRLAGALAAVAALHLFYDVHAMPLPLWACRRLLPVVLPTLFVAAASTVAVLGSRRALAAGVAAVLVAATVWNSRPLLGAWYFTGASQAVADVAALLPGNALVFVDSALMPAELDAPLLLLHGRHAVQARGAPTDVERYLFFFVAHLPDVPIYLVRPGTFLPPVPRPGVYERFELAGQVRTSIRILGADDPKGVAFYVRVYRLVVDPA